MGGAESIPEREGGDVHGRIVVHTIVIGRDEPGRMSTCKDARASTGPGASTHSPTLSREDGNSPWNAETHRNDRPQKLPDRSINKATRKRRANVASLASHRSPFGRSQMACPSFLNTCDQAQSLVVHAPSQPRATSANATSDLGVFFPGLPSNDA